MQDNKPIEMIQIFEGEPRLFGHFIDADQDRWIFKRISEISKKKKKNCVQMYETFID